ncbi:Golgi kish family protein Ksh1 [Schizosaccharomyces osmophilus]|uniref:Protein kish n=1 Tax=Schizosaccharomyces osmophilus TaxID=2545709 RepID=A0AAE9W8X5_9SCHI|nr:Golgi kish family protein Ksh1 [Schizosaccharomyces osmophilus]WBW71485.1 Golgi kish family protein Ksh1 [Schizosaccharomyces osmophilus]
MTAIFNFQSLLSVLLLTVCTCTYIHRQFPALFDKRKEGVTTVFWKCARIGERASPYISLFCVFMALRLMLGSS